MALPPKYSPEEIERRLVALEAARWNNAIDGCYEGPENALVLDACARVEIDRSEFNRRIRENL